MFIPGFQLLVSSLSMINEMIVGFVLYFTSKIESCGNFMIDSFDTLIYYAMNSVMLIVQLFELTMEAIGYVNYNISLISSGYKNNFINNIN